MCVRMYMLYITGAGRYVPTPTRSANCLCFCVYIPDDDVTEVETCRVTQMTSYVFISCTVCWIKQLYYCNLHYQVVTSVYSFEMHPKFWKHFVGGGLLICRTFSPHILRVHNNLLASYFPLISVSTCASLQHAKSAVNLSSPVTPAFF